MTASNLQPSDLCYHDSSVNPMQVVAPTKKEENIKDFILY